MTDIFSSTVEFTSTTSSESKQVPDPLFWSFEDDMGIVAFSIAIPVMLILLGCVYVVTLKLRLKYCGARLRTQIISKYHRPATGDTSESFYLYFNYQNAMKKKNVHKDLYKYFHENDDIEIMYDPKCPIYSFGINTDKIPKDKLKGKRFCVYTFGSLILFVTLVMFVGSIIFIWGSLNDEKTGSEIVVYILCQWMWSLLFAAVLFAIVIPLSCIMVIMVEGGSSGNNGANPLLERGIELK